MYILYIYINKLFTPNISGVFSRHALEAPAASAGQQDLGSDSVSIGAAKLGMIQLQLQTSEGV